MEGSDVKEGGEGSGGGVEEAMNTLLFLVEVWV